MGSGLPYTVFDCPNAPAGGPNICWNGGRPDKRAFLPGLNFAYRQIDLRLTKEFFRLPPDGFLAARESVFQHLMDGGVRRDLTQVGCHFNRRLEVLPLAGKDAEEHADQRGREAFRLRIGVSCEDVDPCNRIRRFQIR